MSTDPQQRKITLFGNFGTGNLGNEATLQAMLYNLRRYLPKTEISCICPCPENTASSYRISAFPIRAPFPIRKMLHAWRTNDRVMEQSKKSSAEIPMGARHLSKAYAMLRTFTYPFLEPYRWFKAIASLKGSDMLIMTGTGMLGDFGISPFSLHYDILMWSIIARLCRCKLLFVSVGGGPIRHPLSRYFVKAALALAHYRSYRDAFSKSYLEDIGFDAKDDAIYPDLAFSLPRLMVRANQDHDGQGVVIGVGLMNYYNRLARSGSDETTYRDYIAKLAAFIVRLLEHKFTVRLLIGDVVYDAGVKEDLKKLLEKCRLKYGEGRIIDEPTSSVEELLSQLASVDVVVASRFHNVLLALMLRKPVVAISYHEKFEPLMRGVGLAEFCQDIEHIDIEELIAMVDRLRGNLRTFKPQLARETEAYRIALDEQYNRIFKVFSVVSHGRDTAASHDSITSSTEFAGWKSVECLTSRSGG
jgi:polysaccharide pyruvyl transferase WcaK-like protein